jgi:hypothetical protein
MTTTHNTPQTTPLLGDTLLVVLSPAIRPGKAYIPPEPLMREFLHVANENDGRLLWVSNRGMKAATKKNRSIVFANSATPLMVCADIVGSGTPYNPKTWKRSDPYQPISTEMEPRRSWIKLDNVRELQGFDPSDYMVHTPDGVMGLEEFLNKRITGSVIKDGQRRYFETGRHASLLSITDKTDCPKA